MIEEWRTCVYNGEILDGYEVSSLGNVRNVNYRGTGRTRMLHPSKRKDGYLQVLLRKNGKRFMASVHRLVAFTFIENDDVENKTEVNHINEIKHDCRVENLEWCTRDYNLQYGTRVKRATKTQSYKVMAKSLTENKVIVFQSINQAVRFGFHYNEITKCCKGKMKSHKGYTWHYVA